MAIRLGIDCKLYFNNGGDWAAPTWQEIGNARDVNLSLETGEADVTTRGNAGWRATLATLKEGSIEFEMIWDTEDDAFAAFQQAYFSNAPIEVAAMDGDVAASGSSGLHAEFSVTNFSRNEPLEEAVTASVTIKPTYSANAPEWLETA
jgi:predicted secreted protein